MTTYWECGHVKGKPEVTGLWNADGNEDELKNYVEGPTAPGNCGNSKLNTPQSFLDTLMIPRRPQCRARMMTNLYEEGLTLPIMQDTFKKKSSGNWCSMKMHNEKLPLITFAFRHLLILSVIYGSTSVLAR